MQRDPSLGVDSGFTFLGRDFMSGGNAGQLAWLPAWKVEGRDTGLVGSLRAGKLGSL